MKELVKQWLGDLLGPFYPWVMDSVVRPLYAPITTLWSPGENLFVLYLFTSVLLALIVYRQQEQSATSRSLRQFLGFLVPARIYLHRSALLDYKFVFVKGLVNQILFGGIAVGSGVWLAGPLSSQLEALLGASPFSEPTLLSRIAFTLCVAIAVEFGHYVGHYLQHRVPLLWHFHKTHHSCEVLTPISVYRNHPVDTLVKGTILSVCTGIAVGVYTYLYPNGIPEITVLNVSIVFFLSYLAANLLHSHIWLSYGWRLNHVLVSPCMHQIHHSSEPRHFDRNFANFFSFWDWIFGTIYVPRSKESFELGISNKEHLEFNSVWSLYMVPFKKVAQMLGVGSRGDSADGAG